MRMVLEPRVLAWKLCKQQSERSVFKIREPETNTMCHKPEEVQRIFEKYYKMLYPQPESAEPKVTKSFQDSLDLPSTGG